MHWHVKSIESEIAQKQIYLFENYRLNNQVVFVLSISDISVSIDSIFMNILIISRNVYMMELAPNKRQGLYREREISISTPYGFFFNSSYVGIFCLSKLFNFI